MSSSAILVTGFVERSLASPRAVAEYLQWGRALLKYPMPKVLFMDRNWIHLIEEDAKANDTLVVPTSLSELTYYPKLPPLVNKSESGNILKDTLEYFALIVQKTEWMRQATTLRPEGRHYVWVDFGILHVVDEDNFEDRLLSLNCHRIPDDKIRIAGIDAVSHDYACTARKALRMFAGGVFGGTQRVLRIFAEEVHSECRRLIEEENTLMWEVNIWYNIFKRRPELFDWYPANHNASILLNF